MLSDAYLKFAIFFRYVLICFHVVKIIKFTRMETINKTSVKEDI